MVVCLCNAIRERDLRAALHSGARCHRTAYASLGKAPKCGQCVSYVRDWMASETLRAGAGPA